MLHLVTDIILRLHQLQIHLVVIIDLLLQAEPLDEVSLKKLLLQFEKRLSRNQELRIKFPDMPEKYVFYCINSLLSSTHQSLPHSVV